jgi:hypothetical protein
MAFSIGFRREMTDGSQLGNAAQFGEIELGEYRETFTALIGFWSPRDYEDHWRQSLRRLVDEDMPTCLITSLHDPSVAEILQWWLLYPAAGVVRAQSALLPLRHLASPFDTRNPYGAIPQYRSKSVEGYDISEWTIPTVDVRAFLRRM